MMAALLTVPLLIAVTLPIDTVRALAVRTVVQQAADAAALVAASSDLGSASERGVLADSVFQANIQAQGANLNIFSAGLNESSSSGSSTPDTFTYSVTATVGDGATILPLGTLFHADVDAVAKKGNEKIDIAVVLDSTASLVKQDGTSTTRIQELQTAAHAFIDRFSSTNEVQLAVVPFNTQVKADPATVAEIDFTLDCSELNSPTSYETSWCASGKDGFTLPTESSGYYVISSSIYSKSRSCRSSDCTLYYIQSRGYKSEYDPTDDSYKINRYESTCFSYTDYDQGDVSPCGKYSFEATIFVEPRVPDGTSYSCYYDRDKPYDVTGDVSPVEGTATDYVEAACRTGLSYMMALTDQYDEVRDAIDDINPQGSTNITIGVAWGMEALSTSPPLMGARREARKVMIVMTDGTNTSNRWGEGAAEINERTKLACENARAAGIDVYTVNLVDGDSSLLSECAGDSSRALNATRGDLEETFQKIANQIIGTYLAG